MNTMQNYSYYCTVEQTQRAYELGAPIEKFREHEAMSQSVFDKNCAYLYQEGDELVFGYIPTTQQMIGWLREKKKIVLFPFSNLYQISFEGVSAYREEDTFFETERFEDYNEAELAAIDAALDYLEKGGTK